MDEPPVQEIVPTEPTIAPWALACLTQEAGPATKLTINDMDMGGKLNER